MENFAEPFYRNYLIN